MNAAPVRKEGPKPRPWDASAVWCIGRFERDGTEVLWPSTRAERASAAAFAQRRLGALGIGVGDRVLLISMMSEGVQIVPYEDALRQFLAVMTPADATHGDAGRVLSVLQRAHPRAVIGLNARTIEGLDALGHGLSLFETVEVLVADELGARALEGAGMSPYRWTILGPAMAIECPARRGPHLDGSTWDPSVVDGTVVLRPLLADHATGAGLDEQIVNDGIVTGVRADITTDRCECGSDDPRLVLAT